MYCYELDDIDIHFSDNKDEVRNVFSTMLCSNEKNKISFINPEIFMKQQQDDSLHEYFKTCTYNFVDGIGLLYAINRKCKKSFNYTYRCPGTDFFDYLPDSEIRIFLYGSTIENVEKAKCRIEAEWSNIKIVDFIDGYSSYEQNEVIERINSSEADILIVCKGCPIQEKWITENFDKLNIKIVFGNGGSIDFWSGQIKRAPEFMIKIGLEFLFRLFQDFNIKRIKRQLKLFIFSFKYKTGQYKITEKRIY